MTDYWDARRKGVQVDEIEGNKVYYLEGKFYVQIDDDFQLEDKTVDGLESQARKLKAKPTKVMRFGVSVYAHAELKPFEAIGYSKRMIYQVDDEGKKRRTYSDNLYIHTPELEQVFKELLQRAEKLSEDISATLKEAQRFPSEKQNRKAKG